MTAKNMTTLALKVGDKEVDPNAVVDAIQTIVHQIDTFLADWLEQAGRDIAIREARVAVEAKATPDENLRLRIEDFRHEKSQWEAKRKQEFQQIQEKADELTEAWLRLESEQRRFLQLKETQRHGGRTATAEVKGRETNSFAMSDKSSQPSSDLSTSKDGTVSDRSQPMHESQTRDAAVLQFQRLRREIESSRPSTSQL